GRPPARGGQRSESLRRGRRRRGGGGGPRPPRPRASRRPWCPGSRSSGSAYDTRYGNAAPRYRRGVRTSFRVRASERSATAQEARDLQVVRVVPLLVRLLGHSGHADPDRNGRTLDRSRLDLTTVDRLLDPPSRARRVANRGAARVSYP